MQIRKPFALLAGLALALFAMPAFAQDTGGSTSSGRGGPVLDNTQPLVTGGALANRRPGTIVQQGVAAFQSNTAKVGQIFPIESQSQTVGGTGTGTGTEVKFRRQLLISIIDTFFNLLNTFITSGALFSSTGGLGDLSSLLGGTSTTSASTVNASTASTNVAKTAFTPAPGVSPTSLPIAGTPNTVY